VKLTDYAECHLFQKEQSENKYQMKGAKE